MTHEVLMVLKMTYRFDLDTHTLKVPEETPLLDGSKPPSSRTSNHPGAFNTNAIVYDNTPWRPGREFEVIDKSATEDERKLKNLATRIMSNGVEVLVKDKSGEGKHEQRKLKVMHETPLTATQAMSSILPKKMLLSSAVATFVNRQQISALFPLHQLMQHNYIIKTCMTTYTYLTTVVQNKRSAISTFETIVSVVTTESLTNLYSDILADLKPTKTKYMEVKTIQPTAPTNMYVSNYAKIDKRIDSSEDGSPFDLIQPSESSHASCTTTSCSCSHSKTETLKTRYTNIDTTPTKYGVTSKFGTVKLDLQPTNKDDKKTPYGPYEFESTTQVAPVDKVVEKYTEVMNDYSDEKDNNSVEGSDLLTNEQAPPPLKTNKISNKAPEKSKPQKPSKHKFVVADLLKLGTLGIKGLTQLAPVFEKMTGSFIKRQDTTAEKVTSTTVQPTQKVIAYNADKRIDRDFDSKQGRFPIYIPVDEMETSESQIVFTNATLHQNMAWAAEHKQPKSHHPHKMIHESPLVNGGIPISPGEIITAHSDVIVGKPAVGGPLTLAASGIKLHNPVNPPPLDSFVAANEQYQMNERPSSDQPFSDGNVDDSFDLRPPDLPKSKPNRYQNSPRPSEIHDQFSKYPYRMPNAPNEDDHKNIPSKSKNPVLLNHGRPAFLDYIPSFGSPQNNKPIKHHINFKPAKDGKNEVEIADNSPSSSEIVNTHIRTDDEYTITSDPGAHKPFLVDIQPSRVANVLIPHGSSTALVFAGSSEPHKTGDYIDDPLPYPEPGYFGSFSIDAPQMTNVHNVAPNNNKKLNKPKSPLESYKPNTPYNEHSHRNDLKLKWRDTNQPLDFNKIPPPTSNQETHVQVGPQITAYNPDIYISNNGDFEKYNHQIKENSKNEGKEVIDKEYENFLAVPPPPPKIHFNQDHSYEKNKPYNQRPITQHKPVQDMNVFLNIQHPVPKEQLPPKVTSEIYFAAQGPNNKPSPTYTIHMPHSQPQYNTFNAHHVNNVQTSKISNNVQSQSHSTSPILSSHNVVNKSILANDKDHESTYTVTLNTATNVASNVNDAGQVIGSSVPVPVGTALNNGQLNADIPIGTNFAIRVEENVSPQETHNIQGHQNTPLIYNEHNHVPFETTIGGNRWNKSSAENENTIIGHNYYNQKQENIHPVRLPAPTSATVISYNISPSIPPSVNSHANFPMMYEHEQNIQFSVPSQSKEIVKPVTENFVDIKYDQKRPGKHIPNLPTNSHGWYSNVAMDDTNIRNININSESTTRKVIPLHDYSENNKPPFGQKILSAGKPPTEFWSQKKPLTISNLNVGKPFSISKSEATEKASLIPSSTVKPYENNNYLPSHVGAIKQPAYDIPIRDNSEETTTVKAININTDKNKPVYENSEEIYDGEEEPENIGDNDGEVSSESMKIPIVSVSNESQKPTQTSTELTLLQDEVLNPISLPSSPKPQTAIHTTSSIQKVKPLIDFNPDTQTEKPFNPNNRTNNFHTNAIKPIYENKTYMKPRPFTVGTTAVLDHQLQQPHWQINQLLENSTNMSYEDNLDLNIGEEMHIPSTTKVPIKTTSPRIPNYGRPENELKYKNPPRPVYHSRYNNTKTVDDSNIITSTVHIKDKKPLIVENIPEKSTLPTFTTTADNLYINRSSSEIIDLSPPPPTMDYSFKPSTNDEMIMGMSPPPPRNPPGMRHPPRISLTPRPGLPPRTLPPYRTKPPKTMPPRLPQRTTKKPVYQDEVSTYRPSYDILNNIRRPTYNREQPSSLLLPPPRVNPANTGSSIIDMPTSAIDPPMTSNVIFPTPISSGWLTSSGIGFSSSFNFNPTSIQFPDRPQPTILHPVYSESPSSENSYSYENEYSSENSDEASSSEKPVTENGLSVSKEVSAESATKMTITSTESKEKDFVSAESSQENTTTDRMKVLPIGNKNRTRKPYPFRNDDKKPSTSKFKLPSKPTAVIRPTRTLTRPEILYPTRHTSIKKIIRPIPTRSPIVPTSIIESSESSIDDEFIKPTEVLSDSMLPSMTQLDITSPVHKGSASIITPSLGEDTSTLHPIHHAGNEVKISDEIIPTKTEFRTTVVTLTKTLSEPPLTVSSVGYVNLTHTLTVTHTKTSLVSLSEGAVTQTLVLTNTHTSTIVDVVTEIHTKVQPTTIVETVTKHIPVPQVEPTPVQETSAKTKIPLDDITMSSEEEDNLIIRDHETTENIQKIDTEADGDSDTFFVVMNKSQNGGQASPPISTDLDTGDYDITRNEQVNSNGVSQVLFGEILLAGTPYLETTNVHSTGYGKECQPDCKASRNERCQRIDGLMKCVCRPGFARMFPDRPCKPTYTYSVKLALGSQGNSPLHFHSNLSDNSSKQYQALAVATHEGINRMVMQSDLRDVFHGVHINGFHAIEMKGPSGDKYQGVMNDFYVQLSDNAHESRLKEVIEKYLRNNNYSLGGTDVHAAGELVDRLDVSDFDECTSGQFHDCSEHAQCFNLRGTYTCSCLEGYADLSVNTLYPGRICSAEPVGCEKCNYHGSCYSRDDQRVLCECFQWYAGSTCQLNLKVVLISLVVLGAILTIVLAVCAVIACSKKKPRQPKRSIVACIQSMPSLHQGAMPSKQRQDRRALISERGDGGDASSIQNVSLPYMPSKRASSSSKKCVISDPPSHDPPPPPAPAVMIPRARLHAHHDVRDNVSRKRSLELSSEAKLISYLETGATTSNDEMRRKHSLESSYSALNKDRHKQGALVSAGFKVSTTVRPEEVMMKEDRDDLSSVNKADLEAELHFDSLRKSYSQEDLSEWTDAERRIGELTLSEARSVGGTLPASTGRAASSTRLTHQEANTMAERDLGSTFLLPHVHLYKPDLTSDVSEFDSL